MSEKVRQLLDSAVYFSAEIKEYLQKLREPHPFMRLFLEKIGWTPQRFLDFVRARQEHLLSSLTDHDLIGRKATDEKIQQNCHKIWLTAPYQPHLPPADYLAPYFKMCKSHPPDWTHFFWTNSDAVVRHLELEAYASGAKVIVQNVNNIHLGIIDQTLRTLIADKKFVLAADVLKFVILDRFGGIYSDLGVCFDRVILSLVSAASYSYILAGNMFFQTSWVSCRKNSLLSSTFLGILNNPEVLSRSYALGESDEVNAGSEVHAFCGLGYTACVLLFLPADAPILVLPPHSRHLTWKSQQSWYGNEAKHGNALIRDTKPSIVRYQKYLELEKFAASSVTVINCDGLLEERLNVIAKLFDYFQTVMDPLSQKFSYYGSLKCSGWHNYGFVFFLLIEMLSCKRLRIAEIGDSVELWGANNNGANSAGGSVVAFTDHFGASVAGLEIQRIANSSFSLASEVLLNRGMVTSLEDHLSRHSYDVLIDNGIHEFGKSIMVLEYGVPKLKESGIYFVEAVPTSSLPKWREYLLDRKYPAAIFSFPQSENNVDNCLVVVFS